MGQEAPGDGSPAKPLGFDRALHNLGTGVYPDKAKTSSLLFRVPTVA